MTLLHGVNYLLFNFIKLQVGLHSCRV